MPDAERPNDTALFDALRLWAERARGQRARRLRIWFEDDSSVTIRLPPCDFAGEPRTRGAPSPPPPDPGAWPPPSGWAFRPGEFAFAGQAYRLAGRGLQVLQRLARRPGEPVTLAQLRADVWGTYSVDDSSIRATLAHLRRRLRDVLDIPPDVDPLPGDDGAYRVAL